ncbi:12831_t:CDS:2, partial [Racocetra fulgida]
FEDIDNEDNEDQISNAMFAPKNTSIVSFDQKSNNYGLGFNPFENAPEFVVQSSINKGTGVFDEEDDDVYGGTSMSEFHTSLMDEDDEDTILPAEYVPLHEFNTENQYVQDANKKNIRQKQTTLAIVAEQRGALLGETPLNAPARSVFDYVSRKDKERLDSIIRPVIDTLGDKNTNKPPEVKIPKIEKDVALAALKGFIPFEDNKKKQARYKKYLEIHAELIAPELLKQPEELTADEFSKELDEFSQAARIFRPMSKMIASRFVTSTSPAEEFKQPTPGLRAGAGAGDDLNITPIKQKDTSQLNNESTAEAAARMNMFDHVQNSTSGKTQKGQKEALSKETMNEILNKQDAQNFPGISAPVSVSETNDIDQKPYTRPAMELFKSIFGDSGSEDDDEDAPKHKKPPNLVIGDSEPQDMIRDKPPTPISHNIDEDVSATPFRPMFKKKSDRAGGDIPSAEIVKIKSESSSSKSKNQNMKGTLSFDDDSFIGPTNSRKKKKRSHKNESDEDEKEKKHKKKKKKHKSDEISNESDEDEKEKKHKKKKKKYKADEISNESDEDEKERKHKKKKNKADEIPNKADETLNKSNERSYKRDLINIQ